MSLVMRDCTAATLMRPAIGCGRSAPSPPCCGRGDPSVLTTFVFVVVFLVILGQIGLLLQLAYEQRREDQRLVGGSGNERLMRPNMGTQTPRLPVRWIPVDSGLHGPTNNGPLFRSLLHRWWHQIKQHAVAVPRSAGVHRRLATLPVSQAPERILQGLLGDPS